MGRPDNYKSNPLKNKFYIFPETCENNFVFPLLIRINPDSHNLVKPMIDEFLLENVTEFFYLLFQNIFSILVGPSNLSLKFSRHIQSNR